MWFRGNKTGVSIWYVLWEGAEGAYHADIYVTPYGVRQWLLKETFPVHRIGRFTLTASGLQEDEHWNTREEFLAA